MIPNLGCYVFKKSLGMHHCPFRICMCTCKFISMTKGLYIFFVISKETISSSMKSIDHRIDGVLFAFVVSFQMKH